MLQRVAEAAALLQTAERPMIIAGGGVQYSGAVAELTAFAEAHEYPDGRNHRRDGRIWWRGTRSTLGRLA